MNAQDYMDERLDDQISWYSKKSAVNKSWHYRLQILQFILGALITLSIAFETGSGAMRILVPSLGAAVTLVTGLLGVYKFHEKWIEYRTTAETLKHEKYLFLAQAVPYDVEKPLPLLVERVEKLISQENSIWHESMQSSSQSN